MSRAPCSVTVRRQLEQGSQMGAATVIVRPAGSPPCRPSTALPLTERSWLRQRVPSAAVLERSAPGKWSLENAHATQQGLASLCTRVQPAQTTKIADFRCPGYARQDPPFSGCGTTETLRSQAWFGSYTFSSRLLVKCVNANSDFAEVSRSRCLLQARTSWNI
jgi:hypothetical protein